MIAAACVLFLAGTGELAHAQSDWSFTPLDKPSAKGTRPAGVAGNFVVGSYYDSNFGSHGFIFNGSAFTTLDDPAANSGTIALGISGSKVVGLSYDTNGFTRGFVHQGSSFTTLQHAGSSETKVWGVSGSTLVGSYLDNTRKHGFTYQGTTFTDIDGPSGAIDSEVTGISGTTLVGNFTDAGFNDHGFILNGAAYTTVDHPSASHGTFFYGISAGIVVGTYYDASNTPHGFLFDGTTFTPLDHPSGAKGTVATGVDGSTVVGYYRDAGGVNHGFIATSASNIVVEQPEGTRLVSGTSTVDFGSGFTTGAKPVIANLKFVIRNIGRTPLNISSVTISAGPFHIVTKPGKKVPANGKTTFAVAMTPNGPLHLDGTPATSTTTQTGRLIIYSDDPKTPVFKISLTGKGGSVTP